LTVFNQQRQAMLCMHSNIGGMRTSPVAKEELSWIQFKELYCEKETSQT